MIAQRRRLEVASQNLAHQFTLLDAEGNYAPYERREIVFEPNEQGGVSRRRGSHQRCAAADEI